MRRYTLDVYQGAKLWYWRFISPNGKIVADGSEAYSTRSNAIRAVRRLRVIAAEAVIR